MQTMGKLAFAVLFLPAFAWGQASVDEALETAHVYVDTKTGSDSNPGTQAKPFKTIGKAAAIAVMNNQNHVGTKVTILPGTYREAVILSRTGKDTSSPITFEASVSNTVVVSGADVWTGWQVYAKNPSIFTKSWPYRWGACPNPFGKTLPEIMFRREMIYVNGTKLTQVLALSQMLGGTFYVDQAHGIIYIWPPSGTDISTATIEVSVRPELFQVHGKENMVLRGLTFKYANSCVQDHAVIFSDSTTNNILIDEVNFLWNNAGGLSFSGVSDVTIRSSVANHNGQVGFAGYKSKYALWQSDVAAYNNWRGAQGAFYGFATGGCKVLLIHNGRFEGFQTFFNQAPGLHLDTDNINITIDSLLSTMNLRSGILLEANEGPITITNSRMCAVNPVVQPYEGGVNLQDAEYVTMHGNIVAAAGTSEILVVAKAGGRSVQNWETGQKFQLYTQNFSSTSNTIVGFGTNYVFKHALAKEWLIFKNSLKSDYNTWWNKSNTKVFSLPVLNGLKDFAGWKAATGQDAHSLFAAPSIDPMSGCNLSPDIADFWFVTDSPGAGAVRTIVAGGHASYKLYYIPRGFTGTVNLTVAGVQSIVGSAAGLSQASLGPWGTSVLTVTTSSSTPAGTYPITVIAHSGSLTRTVTVSLVIQ